jgi:hypothetical protein
MKVVVHKHSDGISISNFSPTLLGIMTGTGYGWSQDRIDYEVGKFVNPPAPEVGRADSIIRPYIEAIARGGVTEDKAIDLIRAKDDKADCLGCTVIEDSDLPTDRYFRNAWEWSD